MTSSILVKSQLKTLGLKFVFRGRSEIKELANILHPGEILRHCAFGYYQGGTALLVATNSRLLLIDKRPLYMNLEDIRYEMISEVDFAGRLLDAVVEFNAGHKKLKFRSFSDARLSDLCGFVQDKIANVQQLNNAVENVSIWKTYSILQRRRIGKYLVSTEN